MKRALFSILSAIIFPLNIHAITVGAEQGEQYLPLLENKKVALVVNQTSMVKDTHLLYYLLDKGVNVQTVFAPEHGLKGDAGAGKEIDSGTDKDSGIQIISIYGKNKKPTAEQLKDIDIVVFDIQDVGTRFYTYISTLYYVMQACAENDVELLVLDRPNPNDFIDGPMLKMGFQSFVGMYPVPVLHGCTVGELALMANNEGWIGEKLCNLRIVTVAGWQHRQPYSLPVAPSPNLPNDRAIQLYPSLCLFEGTGVSVGRGTDFPFQAIGYPDPKFGSFTFIPQAAKDNSLILQQGKKCYGIDLRNDSTTRGFSLKYLIDFYKKSGQGDKFFTQPSFFDRLAGTDQIRKDIIAGKNEAEIRSAWQNELNFYKELRTNYLLYDDAD